MSCVLNVILHQFHLNLQNSSKQFSSVVERQDKDEQGARDCGEEEEDPEQDIVNLLSKELPVLEDLVDQVFILLLAGHHVDDLVQITI